MSMVDVRPTPEHAHHHIPVASQTTVRRELRHLVQRNARTLGVAVGLMSLSAIAGVLPPWLLGHLVQELGQGARVSDIQMLLIWTLTALLATAVLDGFSTFWLESSAERVFGQARDQFITTVLRLPLSFVERAGTGELVARCTNDVQRLFSAMRYGLSSVTNGLIATVFTLSGAIIIGGWLSLVFVILIPPLWISSRWYFRRSGAHYYKETAQYGRMDAIMLETAASIKTVDALALGSKRQTMVEDSLRRSWLRDRYGLFLRTRFIPAFEAPFCILPAVILPLGLYLCSIDKATVAQVVALTLYSQMLYRPVLWCTDGIEYFQVGQQSLSRLLGVQDVPTDAETDAPEPAGARLELQDVSFHYGNGVLALQEVSLTVEPGERLAIVGPSGAGKSTLGRLLAGSHRPTQGSVTVGGVPVADLSPAQRHREVALLTQEYHVFVGTVRDNILLADADATDEQLESALRTVLAWDWVMRLPDGLDTKIGAGGTALDPAAAQQLALARLIIADPHTVILDEATSMLNPATARDMEQAMSAALRGRTVISIAHRLHTAHDADRVAIVEHGRITELGSHDQLLAQCGSYARLWQAWTAN